MVNYLKTLGFASLLFTLTACNTNLAFCQKKLGDSASKNKKMTKEIKVCDKCGQSSCDESCSSNPKNVSADGNRMKELIPSCNLSSSEMVERKKFLQSDLTKKVVKVMELENGYDLIFHEPIEYSKELLEFINFERGCCSNFSFSLIFEPDNKATHLQIFGSKEIKAELAKGYKELGLIK